MKLILSMCFIIYQSLETHTKTASNFNRQRKLYSKLLPCQAQWHSAIIPNPGTWEMQSQEKHYIVSSRPAWAHLERFLSKNSKQKPIAMGKRDQV
jgi:hypothetical protein